MTTNGDTADLNATLDRVTGGDRSAVLALTALIQAADATGAAGLHDIALAHRANLLAAARGDAAEQAARAITLDEIRQHFSQVAFPRLVASGAVIAVPPATPDATEAWRVEPHLWADVSARRDETLAALKSTSEHAAPRRAAMPRVEGTSVLSAAGLVKNYRRRNVVNNVAVEVKQGEIVGLLGPNGAGKTTTFYMIVGLVPPNEGKIFFDGEDITQTPMYRRARRGVGYLSQEPSIFRKLTVEENILAILETLGLSDRDQEERLETLLDELAIKHLRHSKAYALSGGERRRLEITRALVTQPKFMLLDEPFAGVDPIAVHDIQQIVASLKDRGIGVLITDHNVEQTLDIVDRAYILFEGQVKVSGTVRDLVFDDTVANLYLGPTLTARLRSRFLSERGG